jgi:hypothetical protein
MNHGEGRRERTHCPDIVDWIEEREGLLELEYDAPGKNGCIIECSVNLLIWERIEELSGGRTGDGQKDYLRGGL